MYYAVGTHGEIINNKKMEIDLPFNEAIQDGSFVPGQSAAGTLSTIINMNHADSTLVIKSDSHQTLPPLDFPPGTGGSAAQITIGGGAGHITLDAIDTGCELGYCGPR